MNQSRIASRTARATAVVCAACIALLLTVSSAAAHVTVSPTSIVGGSETQLTFRAPNEQAAAHFTKLVVHLPAAQPLASVSTRPIPGWTAATTKAPLAKPITTDDGTATEYTAAITWTATAGGVAPGQYDNFDISAGPFPASGTMAFTVDQTYSDGTVVHWNQTVKPGAAEPDNPAPVLTLAARADGSGAGSDDVARGLGGAGLVVGVAGLAAAVLAFRRSGHAS